MNALKISRVASLAFLSLLIGACSSSDPKAKFRDLPEICRHYDFSKDPKMAETCGIRQTRYKSYKNIPPQRYLINPKGTTIAIKKEKVELRLPNTLPVELDQSLKTKIDFSEKSKSKMVKNKYEYKEFFTKSGERLKLFKLNIPGDSGSSDDFCFSVPKAKIDKRRKSSVGHSVIHISCGEYAKLINQ
jgi:hypothetical protein